MIAVLVAAGCGAHTAQKPARHVGVLAKRAQHCTGGHAFALGSAKRSYVALAGTGAVVHRTPGGAVLARFGPKNSNGYPTLFGVLGAVVGTDCKPTWYRVGVPMRPNGTTGYVRASSVVIRSLVSRIVVDLSQRRLTLYRAGKPVLRATVAVGTSSTPTPTGRYYVNQRLIPADTSGPYGPAAIGISAFSNVLTGWAQGGPVAIHGTDEPWSIGHAASNGCIRLPNSTLAKLFPLALAGTPVIIHE